jgi:hypothetical protein
MTEGFWGGFMAANNNKGRNFDPEKFLATIGEGRRGLIQTSAAQASAHRAEPAPVWIPRNGKDTNGIPYIVVTCTECLRSFPLNVAEEASPETRETPCLFCRSIVKYIIDFSPPQ